MEDPAKCQVEGKVLLHLYASRKGLLKGILGLVGVSTLKKLIAGGYQKGENGGNVFSYFVLI